ncbi:MAG: sigma-70 family RNA polymerase sigma factor [Planctomycetes bacterium]|nr:sigma-70 family RNA polymerase sigma factor [Planctomycetota bacterium]
MPQRPAEPPATFAEQHRHLADDVLIWAELQLRPLLRRRLDPEDLAQEVWGRALRAFPTFDPARGTFRQWLFGIAWHTLRRQLRDWHRRYRREDPTAAGWHLAAAATDGRTSVPTKVARSDRARQLLLALSDLAEDERQLVQFRGLEGLSHAEVARRLGLTEVNAESRWRRLRQRLADLLPE